MSPNPLQTVLVTGSNGLIGSHFVQEYADTYLVDSVDISNKTNPVDITQYDQVVQTFANSEAQCVIHFAAYTNVTGAWEQRDDKNGPAYQVNVVGTQNIVAAANETNKHLIHLSTAYVFDGALEGMYTEQDTPNPIEWYGKTKLLAEEAVQSFSKNWTIFRIDQPFRNDAFERADLAHSIAQKLQNDSLPPMFTNHYFGPTYIHDFSKVLDWAVRTKPFGLYHASSGEKWTDYEFAQALQAAHKLPGTLQQGDLAAYLETVSRPYQKNTAMNTQKLQAAIDFSLTPIKTALANLTIS